MSDNVVRLRPPSPRPERISAVVRIDATVSLGKLLSALTSGGFVLQHDARSGDFIIRFRPEESGQ